MSFSPYQKKNPGDVLKLQDWLEVQQRIKEELRDHVHLGVAHDGDAEAETIGPLIISSAFAPGAVTAGKIAPGAVGPNAMADGAIAGEHFDPDSRLAESQVRFRSQGGHNHDGVGSRALSAASIGTLQLRDGSIAESNLEGAPADGDLSPEEESYARGRAFTPANVLRAARDLIDHIKVRERPLLVPNDYLGTAGVAVIVRGILLTRLLEAEDGAAAAEYVRIEFTLPGSATVSRSRPEILDNERLRVVVPALGNSSGVAHLRAVRGDGSESRPFTPITNVVELNYQPAS